MGDHQSIDPPTSSNSRVRKVEAILHGTVIDHIPGHMTLKVANLLARENDQVSIGTRATTCGGNSATSP